MWSSNSVVNILSVCKAFIVGMTFLSVLPINAFGQNTARHRAAKEHSAEAPVDTTLCDLVKSADRFNEKVIRVRTLIVRGMESVILYDKTCAVDARVELEWPEQPDPTATGDESFEYAFISSPDAIKRPARLQWRKPPPPVRLVKDETYTKFLAALNQDRPEPTCVSCPVNSVTATMTGRFEHASLRAIRDKSKKIEIGDPYGFGHMNMWDSRFVLQSVSEFVSKPLDESPSK